MYNQPLRKVMDTAKVLLAPPTMTVAEAAREMARCRWARYWWSTPTGWPGIFTERDAVQRVLAAGLDPAITPLSAVMTRDPKVLAPERPFGAALALMYKCGFRHVPVVSDGVPVGIVSSRSALDPDMEDFVAEARRRDRYASM